MAKFSPIGSFYSIMFLILLPVVISILVSFILFLQILSLLLFFTFNTAFNGFFSLKINMFAEWVVYVIEMVVDGSVKGIEHIILLTSQLSPFWESSFSFDL